MAIPNTTSAGNGANKCSTALSCFLDHVCACMGSVKKYECWVPFFPMIAVGKDGTPLTNPDCKRSRYASARGMDKLRDELEKNLRGMMAGSGLSLPKPGQDYDYNIYLTCWALRWVFRSPAAPFRVPLLNPESWSAKTTGSYDDSSEDKRKENAKPTQALFDKDFVDAYMACLKVDWSLSDTAVATFRRAIESMLDMMDRCSDELMRGHAVKADWPFELNQDFINRHAKMGSHVSLPDIMADIMAILFVAALYGPNDYRWECGYLNRSWGQFFKTEEAESGFDAGAKLNGSLPTYPIITRVTYDANSTDELDYIMCSEERHLRNAIVVRFGRAARDAVLHNQDGEEIVLIRLTDWRLDDSQLAGVSNLQASIERDTTGAWDLVDWKSSFGTLIVSRSGERTVVGGKDNERTRKRLQSGDVICFGHHFENGENRADALLPCYVFNLGVGYQELPDLRRRSRTT